MAPDVWLSAVFEGEDDACAGGVALVAEERGSPPHWQDAPKTALRAASRYVGWTDKGEVHQTCRAETARLSFRQAPPADKACARYEEVEERAEQQGHGGSR